MKKILVVIIAIFLATTIQAQMNLGLVAGVNMSDEVTAFKSSLNSSAREMPSLKGVVIGPTMEIMIQNIDLGLELGTFYSRKGSNFNYMLDNPSKSYAVQLEGYKNIEYLEIPLTLKWKFGPRDFKMFIAGGLFWGYAFSGSMVVEKAEDLLNSNQPLPDLVKTTIMKFGDNNASAPFNTIDRGYTIGVGVQFVETLQLSVNYSYSTRSVSNEKSIMDLLPEETYGYDDGDFGISSNNSTFSVRLTYLFTSGGN